MPTPYLSSFRDDPDMDRRIFAEMLVMAIESGRGGGRVSEFDKAMDEAPDYPGLFDGPADKGCRTPLSAAAARFDRAAVQRLLLAGAAVDARDGLGQTPLLACTLSNMFSVEGTMDERLSCSRLLLAAGADPHATGPKGEAVLPSCFTAQGPDAVLFAHDLIEAGVKLSGPGSRGSEALFKAVEVGGVASVRFLVESGADPRALDAKGRSPLEAARRLRNHGALAYLEALELRSGLAPAPAAPAPRL